MKKLIALVAVVAFLASAAPAFASHDNDIDVTVKNTYTTVSNGVVTGANTGGNTADGGSASTLVKKSGNVKGSDNDGNSTSAGGNSSNGGDGGTITTGDAWAKSKVTNTVNSTHIKVKTDCACEGDGDIDIEVKNKRTDVSNGVLTDANTGVNYTDGGSADTTVKKSGNVKGSDNDGNSTSAGGNSSNGGDGGTITTGDAWAKSKVTNTVNSTVVRVRRI